MINEIPGHAIHMFTNENKRFLAAALDISDRIDLFIWDYPYEKLKIIITPFSINFHKSGKMPVNFDKDGKYCAIERGGELYLYDTTNWNVIWREKTDLPE